MVEIARLLLEVDSTGAKKGAKEASDALDRTAEAAKRAEQATVRLGPAWTSASAQVGAYNYATLSATGPQAALAREAARAASAIEHVGHGGEYAKHVIKGLAAETLGLHGHVLNLVLGLNNVGDALGALTTFATSPLALIGSSIYAGIQILKEFEENFDRIQGKIKASAAADLRVRQLQGLLTQVQPPTLSALGGTIATGSLFPPNEELSAQMRERVDFVRAGLSDEIQRSFDQSLSPEQLVTDDALKRIRERLASVFRALPQESALVAEEVAEQLAGTFERFPSLLTPELLGEFEGAASGAVARADQLRAALDGVAEAAKRDREETAAFFRAQEQAAATASVQFEALIAGLDRTAEFAGQGPDAIARASRAQEAYTLALKAAGGDAEKAAPAFQQWAAAAERAEAALQRSRDAAAEEQEILRVTARVEAEISAERERRDQRAAAARSAVDSQLGELRARGAALGTLPGSLQGFEAAKREQQIQSQLAAFRAKIGDLPIDEQNDAAARYEATLRSVVAREVAWGAQEDALKAQLEQSKEAIEAQAKAAEESARQIEELARAFTDPLGNALDGLYAQLGRGELSWKSFGATAIQALQEISQGVFHETVTEPLTKRATDYLKGVLGGPSATNPATTNPAAEAAQKAAGGAVSDAAAAFTAQSVATMNVSAAVVNLLGGGIGGGSAPALFGAGFGGGGGGGGPSFTAGDAFAFGAGAGPGGTGTGGGITASVLGGGLSAAAKRLIFGGSEPNPNYPTNLADEPTPPGSGFGFGFGDASATARPSSGQVDSESSGGLFAGMNFSQIAQLLQAGTIAWLTGGSGLGFTGGGFGVGFAHGAVFRRGRTIPFYRGDVFDSPATFPMAGGDTGMLGEAGPEAIMPLARGPDGRLGVRASRARRDDERDDRGGTTVVNNWKISTPNADSFRRSRRHMDQDEKRRAARN